MGITGAAGRMGRTLIEAIALKEGQLTLAAAIEQPGSSLLGADSGELSGQGKNGVTVVGSLAEVIGDIDVLIDFTVPAALMRPAFHFPVIHHERASAIMDRLSIVWMFLQYAQRSDRLEGRGPP